MKKVDLTRLKPLLQIAETRASLAISDAATARRKKDATAAELSRLQGSRQEILATANTPEVARVATKWLIHYELRTVDLTAKLARLQAELDSALDKARQEEGRRQVLKKIEGQAS